jgi:mono/diheme cytochrome c family protein
LIWIKISAALSCGTLIHVKSLEHQSRYRSRVAPGEDRMKSLISAAFALLIAAPASAQTSTETVAAGRSLAMRSCSACHVVSERQQQPAVDGVSSFAQIARNPNTTPDGLRTFIQSPHPPMPNFSLSRKQLDEVTAYIMSLRTGAPAPGR